MPPESGAPSPRGAGDQGSLVVELALAALILVMVVFGVIDLGRAYSLQNRLTNSAREGAASAQFRPGNVNAGCSAGNNVVDRATNEDSGLASISGFAVTVAKAQSGANLPYTGCGTPVGTTVSPGDTVVVTVTANFDVLTPIIGRLVGNTVPVSKSVSVVVQG